MSKSSKTFENSMNELEALVNALESGDLPLDESLKLFEQGIKLSRSCQKILDNAELKIEKLSQEHRLDEQE